MEIDLISMAKVSTNKLHNLFDPVRRNQLNVMRCFFYTSNREINVLLA
jgi:hypothetical protein